MICENIVALIPARKNSTRLFNKNFLKIKKKSLINYTIDSAKKSKIFKYICISTDNDKFLKNLKDKTILKFSRKKNLASSSARLIDVCVDFIKSFEKKYGKIDILCLLYATSPLRNYKDIKNTIKKLKKNDCNFAISVTNYNLPPHQALLVKKNFFVRPLFKKLINKRDEALGHLVVDNGSTYAFFRDDFLKEKTFYGKKLKVNIMPKNRSVDLNDLEDLKILKKML